MSIAEQALWDKKGGVTMNQKSMLTAQDLAERFGVSIYTIYRLTTKPNGLPGYRVGRCIRFKEDEVERYSTGCRILHGRYDIVSKAK